MAVSYTNTLSIDMLLSDLTALIAWHDDLLRRSFYPESQTAAYAPPQSILLAWCRTARDNNTIEAQVVNRLELVFDELVSIAQSIADNQGLTLPQETYDIFSRQFNAYLERLRQLYQELAGTAGAIDLLTGLRTPAGLRAELKREQDRYDRKGTPFSIASIALDKLDHLKNNFDKSVIDAVYTSVAQMIARTIRSFDDAYFMGEGEYLVVLKHVEFMDACAVMDRLCAEIAQTPLALTGGGSVAVTTSMGIAEAQHGEPPDGVLKHAKAARLQAASAGGNRTQEYHEKSALEHFARDMNRER